MITPTAGAGPIHETQSVVQPPAPQPPAAAEAAKGAAVSLRAIPSTPPPEVLDQMAQASRTYEQLSAQGRTLHFGYDEAAGRASVEVRDRGGNVLGQLSLAQALDVAAGAPLE